MSNIYTNEGLVTHAKNALNLKTKYMWGGILRQITQAYIKQLRGMYGPSYYPPSRVKELEACIGKDYYGVDCVGLIKSYYWSGKPNGGTGSPKYNPATDCNASTMFSRAKVKGKIKDIPEIPGLIVYSSNPVHVGIYIGKGLTIESTLGSRGDGVIKRPLDNLWTDWFECPYIEYKHEELQVGILDYPAVVRDIPSSKGKMLGRLAAGTKITFVKGSETAEPGGYTYVRLGGGKDQWIVKTAIHNGGDK